MSKCILFQKSKEIKVRKEKMTRKIVGLSRDFRWPIHKQGYEELEAEYVEIPCKTESEIVEATTDADAVFAQTEHFSGRVIEHMRKCRIIGIAGTGYDNVDLDAATEHGICVSNTPEYCTEEVSDHAMALLLACARKIVMSVIGVKAGEWDSLMDSRLQAKLTPIFRLRGQTLGIIGLGRIGRVLVPKARGFGMNVISYDPYVDPCAAQEIDVELVGFADLLGKSDFISLHVPLTDETSRMLGLEQFEKMKPSAFVINTSRGGVVDETSLYTALTRGYIAGAGLDLTDPEPPAPDNLLLQLENVMITPHSAYYSEQSLFDVLKQAEEEVFRVLGGEWPQHLVNTGVKENYTRRWGQIQDDSRFG
jgi:D-3-phosphoglycerate dehydrogenase